MLGKSMLTASSSSVVSNACPEFDLLRDVDGKIERVDETSNVPEEAISRCHAKPYTFMFFQRYQ